VQTNLNQPKFIKRDEITMKTKRTTVLITVLAALCIVAAIGFASAQTISISKPPSVTFTPMGNGYCLNLTNVLVPDGKCAEIICPTVGDGGMIQRTLSNSSTTGSCYAYGSGNAYIYVKPTGSTNWVQVSASTLTSSYTNIQFTSAFGFDGIAIAILDPAHAYIDYLG